MFPVRSPCVLRSCKLHRVDLSHVAGRGKNSDPDFQCYSKKCLNPDSLTQCQVPLDEAELEEMLEKDLGSRQPP